MRIGAIPNLIPKLLIRIVEIEMTAYMYITCTRIVNAIGIKMVFSFNVEYVILFVDIRIIFV